MLPRFVWQWLIRSGPPNERSDAFTKLAESTPDNRQRHAVIEEFGGAVVISTVLMEWNITGGRPGSVTAFRFLGHPNALGAAYFTTVQDFMTRLRGQIPNDVQWIVNPQILIIDETTGDLIGTKDDLIPPVPVRGLWASRWLDGLGIRLELLCGPAPGEIRPLVGHYKLVPWISPGGTAGQVIPSAVTAPRSAMAAWLTGANGRGVQPCVWRRPKPGRAGVALAVTSTRVRTEWTQITRHRRRLPQ